MSSTSTVTTDQTEDFKTAINNGDVGGVATLLQDVSGLRAVINEPWFSFDAPAVVFAAARQNRPLLEALLEAGADINAKSGWKAGPFSALHHVVGASGEPNPDLAAYLIDRGADIDIHSASGLGMHTRLQEFLTANPNMVNQRGPDGTTPLHLAKTPDIAKLLLDHGAEIDVRDLDHGSTPAQWSVKERPEVCRYLIERGATVDIFMAIALGDVNLVQMVLGRDPQSINAQIGKGQFSIETGGSDIYFWKLDAGKTPLQVAATFNNDAVYNILFQRSAPKQQLVGACWSANEQAVRSIMAEHPDLFSSLSHQERALIVDAAWENKIDAVQVMLNVGFDPHIQGDFEGTALDRASLRGFIDLVHLLLQHNPPLTLENAAGGTPLRTCLYGARHGYGNQDSDYPATVEALIKAGSQMSQNWAPTGIEAIDDILRRHFGEPRNEPSVRNPV